MIAMVLVAAAVVGACSSDRPSSEQAAPAAGSVERETVTIEGLSFTPNELTVDAGTTVEWTNDDPVEHTVTSGTKGAQGVPGVSKGKPDRPDGDFDAQLAPGKTFSFTFDTPGTYEYFCRIHGGMTGTVVVD
jgi:plastocyanin